MEVRVRTVEEGEVGAIAACQLELALNPGDATASAMLRLLRRGGNVEGI